MNLVLDTTLQRTRWPRASVNLESVTVLRRLMIMYICFMPCGFKHLAFYNVFNVVANYTDFKCHQCNIIIIIIV